MSSSGINKSEGHDASTSTLSNAKVLHKEHQQMYLFVYKTTHINGRYYIGRHQTENINDGYLGSGDWVSNIKDKSELQREVIATASSIDELILLEEHHISKHFDDPLNMNFKRASVGWTSEDARERALKRINQGTHHFLGENNPVHKQLANGTHNFIGLNEKRVANGTHNFSGGNNPSKLKVADGTHHLLGPEANAKRIADGTHHFLGENNPSVKRAKDGTHHSFTEEHRDRVRRQNKRLLDAGTHPNQWRWTCECGKEGKGKGNIVSHKRGKNCSLNS